jgi:DNA primase
VAPLGTAFTDDQAKLLHRWAEKVFLMLDNDEAGLNAAYKAILSCRKNGLNCFVVDTGAFFREKEENPKDPAEILQKFGAEALKNSVKNCRLDFDFVISRSKAFNETARSVAFLFPYLDALDSEIARDTAVQKIADIFDVEQKAVWEDYTQKKAKPVRAAVHSGGKEILAENPAHPPGKSKAGYERYLLGAVFVNPGLFKDLRVVLLPENLEDSGARELYIILEEWFRGSEIPVEAETRVGELFDRIQDSKLRDFILRQEAQGSFANPEKLINDGMKRIKIKALEKKRRDIIRLLRTASNAVPSATAVPSVAVAPRQADLLAEKIHIDAELTRLKGPY